MYRQFEKKEVYDDVYFPDFIETLSTGLMVNHLFVGGDENIFGFSEDLDILWCPVNRSRFAFCQRSKKINGREKCVANYFLFAASPMAENGQVP